MLGCGVDTSEELVQAHKQHGDHENGRVDVYIAVFRVGRGVDGNSGNRLDHQEKSCRCNKEDSLISRVNPAVETCSVGGFVLCYRGHIPRLKENSRDHRDKVRYLIGVAVDTDSALAQLNTVAVHLIDKEAVGETRDRPHYDSRNKRSCKVHHLSAKFLVEAAGVKELP